jgi:hypothetical protein
MEIIKMPRPMRWLWASLGAYWLADIIHPGFFPVAMMALVMIVVLIFDLWFPPEPIPSEPKSDAEEEMHSGQDEASSMAAEGGVETE